MKKSRMIIFLMLLSLLIFTPSAKAASKVTTTVKNARTLYYGVQKKKKKLKTITSDGCRDYYQGKWLRMTYVFKTSDLCSPNKCRAEFYYDKKLRPIFVFAWKKVNGKKKEYRSYYGTNGRCYRYIGPDHKVHNYKNGRTREKMSSMQSTMMLKAYMNLHYLGYID